RADAAAGGGSVGADRGEDGTSPGTLARIGGIVGLPCVGGWSRRLCGGFGDERTDLPAASPRTSRTRPPATDFAMLRRSSRVSSPGPADAAVFHSLGAAFGPLLPLAAGPAQLARAPAAPAVALAAAAPARAPATPAVGFLAEWEAIVGSRDRTG